MLRIALFASGNGSNAERIARYFTGHPTLEVALVVCNNPSAYVLQRAANLGIPAVVAGGAEFNEPGRILSILAENDIGFIALAGFLKLVPADVVAAYPGRILNIHPALLPRHGGKGMYGSRVHEAVIAAGETESGITIHKVNERYDEGAVVFQARCPILPGDTAETLAARVHELEYEHFPRVIGEVASAFVQNP